MERAVRIIVGIDDNRQHEHYAEALQRRIHGGAGIMYRLADLSRHDWMRQVEDIDLIFWHPRYMGPKTASHFKEKVFFMEQYLGKTVCPGYASIWHFESKVAQSYLFRRFKIPSPATTVTFNHHEGFDLLDRAEMPLVFKNSAGSGSHNVWLVRTKDEGRRALRMIFADQLWYEAEAVYGEGFAAARHCFTSRWFWDYLVRKVRGDTEPSPSYWQEFIAGNERDLRILAVGDRFAAGFWRHNRPDDFRASGSGLLEYDRPLPEELILYCLNINREMHFDSMAYDILFTPTGFVITEMSYGMRESAILNGPGYYELLPSGKLKFTAAHIWPQELIVEWGLQKAAARMKHNGTCPHD